jgi:hypothetical protein
MFSTHVSVLEDLARLDLAERLAEGEKMRLASLARKHRPAQRSVRAIVADALRSLASRLDHDVTAPGRAGRGLVRVG